jgi:hypothetical protein
MSEPNTSAPQGDEAPLDEAGEDLQFDQAEFATPAGDGPACTVCHQPIADEYYELGGKVFCARCRQGVEAAFRGGSRFARVLKAALFGSVAAAVGAVIYYTFIRLTHTNWALISILVGFIVGGAVRKGSGNRGGAFYQGLAILLTYLSIVAVNVPMLLEAVLKSQREEKAVEKAREPMDREHAKAKAPADVAKTPGQTKADLAVEEPQGKAAGKQKAGKAGEPEGGGFPPDGPQHLLAMVVILMGFFLVYPVYDAFHAPISGLIYGFALWEAWKINRRFVLAFNGPFRLGKSSPDATLPEVIDDGP